MIQNKIARKVVGKKLPILMAEIKFDYLVNLLCRYYVSSVLITPWVSFRQSSNLRICCQFITTGSTVHSPLVSRICIRSLSARMESRENWTPACYSSLDGAGGGVSHKKIDCRHFWKQVNRLFYS